MSRPSAYGRRAARVALTFLLLGSIAWSATNAWALYRSPVGGWMVERLSEQAAARLERVRSRSVTPEALAARLAELLDEEPRDWFRIDALTALAEEEGLDLPRDLVDRLDLARAGDSGWFASTIACLQCTYDIATCDLRRLLSCRLPLELTPLGDIDSLRRQGLLYVHGEEIDQIELALATVGIGATGIVVATGGLSGPIKVGASVAKTAHRAGKLPPAVAAASRRAVRDGIDWPRLRSLPIRRWGEAVNPRALRPIMDYAEASGRVYRATDAGTALYLMSRVDSVTDARAMARTAETLGPRSKGVVELAGTSRLVRATMRLASEVYALIAGIVGALVALVALLASSLQTSILRRLRRAAASPQEA